MRATDWNEHASRHFESYVAWLREFCSIPGISATGQGIDASVDFLSEKFKRLGADVEILRLDGANPAILATFSPPVGAVGDRTLLFYDHYDVQPPEPLAEWQSPPFESEVRDGRMYARGVSDNKGDLVSRMAAVHLVQQAGALPCSVKFFIEGEEEIGSPNLARFVDEYADRLKADACIWESGSRDPNERLHLFLGLKGIAYVELSTKVADVDLHSSYGAIVDAASNRLVRAVASLRDANGKVLIPGFYDQVIPPSADVRRAVQAIPFESEKYQATFGVSRFVRGKEGAGALAALLLEPSCTVCGFETGYTGEGAKTVLPKEAKAKVEFRLVPDQSPDRVVERLRHHLEMEGFGDVRVDLVAAEEPYRTDLDDPFVDRVSRIAHELTGREICLYPTHYGSGPMHPIGKRLEVPIVSLGVSHWDSKAHAPNENIRLSDFQETTALVAGLIASFAEASG